MALPLHCLFLASLFVHISLSFPVSDLQDSTLPKTSSLQGTSRLSLKSAADVHSARRAFSDSNTPIRSPTSRSTFGTEPLDFHLPIPKILGFVGFEPTQFFDFCKDKCSDFTGQLCKRRKTPLKNVQTCKMFETFGFAFSPTCCIWSSCFKFIGVSAAGKKENRNTTWMKESKKRACKGKKAAKNVA